MPVISVFFGIVIRMFYQEHGVPHFHAEHQGQEASFTLTEDCWQGPSDRARLVDSSPSGRPHTVLNSRRTGSDSSREETWSESRHWNEEVE